MKKNILLILLTFIFAPTIHAQYLVSGEYMGNNTAALISAFTGLQTEYDINNYKITYNTVDANNMPVIATGLLSVPSNAGCTEFPMVSYAHGTVLKKYDVPSAVNFESLVPAAFASNGYIAVAPDYIGLGDSPGLHPYLHAASEATATIDLIRATRAYLDTLALTDNGELFLTGYSQGGHAAMAAHKHIQDNNLQDEFNVLAAAPASGPYNLSGSQAESILSDEPYSNPGYIVYLIMSYEIAYGNLYNELSDIFQSPYAELIPTYFNGTQNEYSMGVINAQLPQVISELLVDTVLANFENNPNHPLHAAMEANDNYDWAPEVTTRMYYCTGDEQVPYQNSLDAEIAMTENGAPDVEAIMSGTGNHGDCVIPALSAAFNLFNSLANNCTTTWVDDKQNTISWSAYPNPASDEIKVNLPLSTGTISLFNTLGQKVYSINIKATESLLHLPDLPQGVYILQWNAGEIKANKKMFISGK